jgi:hypothetical protein
MKASILSHQPWIQVDCGARREIGLAQPAGKALAGRWHRADWRLQAGRNSIILRPRKHSTSERSAPATENPTMPRFAQLIPAIVLLAAGSAIAEDFCIQSKVFVGKEKEAVESITIFRAGNVYDFLTSPVEITVFDPRHQRFVVLDPERKIKAEVTISQVAQFSEKVKRESLLRNIPLLSFLAEPSFEESYDEATGDLALTSDWMDYHVKTVAPKIEAAAQQYFDYCQWQTQLNTFIKPGSFPPFARLALNDALHKHGRFPVEVQVTRYAQHPKKRQAALRAEHRIRWRLLESDHAKLDEADKHLVTLTPVSVAEYYRRPVDEPEKAAAKD